MNPVSSAPKTAPIRIAFLDDGPHVVSAAEPVEGYVGSGDNEGKPFGYVASRVIRPATHEDIEQWRAQQ